jgi:hypothetical protein
LSNQFVAAQSSSSATGTDLVERSYATGDNHPRFKRDANGAMEWGIGNAPADANLFRPFGGALKTDGSLVAGTSFLGPIFQSLSSDAADTGVVRLGNSEQLCWEASPAGADSCLTVNSSATFATDAPLSVTGSITASSYLASHLQAVSFCTTHTFDAASGNSFKMTLTGNVSSATITNPQTGQFITLLLCQDGTGSRTFAWPGNVKLTGASYAISPTANKCSTLSAVYDGTNWYETARAANL